MKAALTCIADVCDIHVTEAPRMAAGSWASQPGLNIGSQKLLALLQIQVSHTRTFTESSFSSIALLDPLVPGAAAFSIVLTSNHQLASNVRVVWGSMFVLRLCMHVCINNISI